MNIKANKCKRSLSFLSFVFNIQIDLFIFLLQISQIKDDYSNVQGLLKTLFTLIIKQSKGQKSTQFCVIIFILVPQSHQLHINCEDIRGSSSNGGLARKRDAKSEHAQLLNQSALHKFTADQIQIVLLWVTFRRRRASKTPSSLYQEGYCRRKKPGFLVKQKRTKYKTNELV